MLPDDVLIEIFQYLESVKDLANCELVCSGWRKTIVQGYPWKKLYLKKMRSIPIWQKMSEKLKFSDNPEKSKSKEICKNIIISLDKLKSNWLSATFETNDHEIDTHIFEHLDLSYFYMEKNWLLMPCYDGTHLVLNRTTMKVTQRLHLGRSFSPSTYYGIYQNLVFCGNENCIDVYDANTATKVHKLNVENTICGLDVGGPGLLVATCDHGTDALTLTIWSIDSSGQITYNCHLYFTGQGEGVFIDFNYIFVVTWVQEKQSYTIHFISIKTLEKERSLSTRGYKPLYFLDGILALSNEKDCFWFIDVSTGQHLHRIHDIPVSDFIQDCSVYERFFIMKNTNFIVLIIWNIEDDSTVNIYDLEAMRNQQSTPQEILCASVKLDFVVNYAEMDEFQIVCSGRFLPDYTNTVFVLDFFKPQSQQISAA